MKTQPLVSIIIPTYNRAHLIGETLDSVLAQTYQNWECIVVDDGSTDGTDLLITEYSTLDFRIKYYIRPNNHLPGGSGARNYGLAKCQGEFVNFLDSDDLFHPDAISLKISLAVTNGADIVISKNCRKKNELNSYYTIEKTFLSDSFDIDFILSRNSILIGEPLIRLKALGNINFDEKLVRSQDFDFLLRLFRKKLKYCKIDAVLYYYRENPISISRKASSGYRNESRTQLKIVKQNLKYYQGNKLIEQESKRTIRKMYIALMKKGRIDRIIENFNFYRKGFEFSLLQFMIFFIINLITKRGFDRMRKGMK